MRKFILVAAALATVSTAAHAAVTFDAETGAGFVGKGDVQTAFGWNNAAAQKNAAGVTFRLESTTEYQAVCTWTTGEGTRGEKTHNVSHKRSTALLGQVAYDLKKTGQYTGYTLTGFGSLTSDGNAPVVGSACMGNPGHDGTWSSVEELGSSGEQLFATFGGNSVELFY